MWPDIILFMMASTERLVEGYEGNTVIILVRSAQSVATKVIDNLQDLHASASVAIATLFQSVLPTIDSLRIDACEALAVNPDTDIPEVCYSNYTLLNDLHSQSDAFVTLVFTSLSQKMSPVKNFLKSAIDAGADTIADAAVVVDPLQPWMIQMAMGVGGLVAFLHPSSWQLYIYHQLFPQRSGLGAEHYHHLIRIQNDFPICTVPSCTISPSSLVLSSGEQCSMLLGLHSSLHLSSLL